MGFPIGFPNAAMEWEEAINKLMNEKIENSSWLLLKKSHHIGYVEEPDVVIESIKNLT